MSELQQRLSSRAFALLCLSVFLAYSHQAFLTPTVPLYVTDLGGSTLMAGLVLLSFSIPSFTFRPLVGYWTDTWNVFGVLIIGTLLLATGAILHLPRVLGLLFLAGAVRGLGWAGLNTGGFSLLAHIAPSARRGEAASYYNISTASPNTLFPALAIFLLDVPHAGFVAVFLLSAGTALLATLTGASIPREKILSEQRQIKSQKLSLSLLLEPSILLPTALLLSLTMTISAVIAFLPLYAREQGIGGVGWFYVASGVTTITAQLIIGRISDRLGRGPALLFGYGLTIGGLLMLIAATNLTMIIMAGVIYTAGQGLAVTTTTAFAMDRAHPERRGTAMATYSMAFQMGLGFGATVSGAVVDAAGFRAMYAATIGMVAVGVMLTLLNWTGLRRRAPLMAAA